MTISKTTVSGNFDDYLYALISGQTPINGVTFEGFSGSIYLDTGNIPTIGAGLALSFSKPPSLSLRSDLDTALTAAGMSWTTAQKDFIEDVMDDINAGNISQAESDLTAAYQSGGVFFGEEIDHTEGQNLFEYALNDILENVRNGAQGSEFQAFETSHAGTEQLAAIYSLVYNVPALFGSGLADAISNGDQARAWYEILYNHENTDENGVMNRREAEADLFKLVNDGADAEEIALELNTLFNGEGVSSENIYDRIQSRDEYKPFEEKIASYLEEVQDFYTDGKSIDFIQIADGDWISGGTINAKAAAGKTDANTNNLIIGSDGADTIDSKGGHDWIYGGGGDDSFIIELKPGSDNTYIIDGGADNDTLIVKSASGMTWKDLGIESNGTSYTFDGGSRADSIENLELDTSGATMGSLLWTSSDIISLAPSILNTAYQTTGDIFLSYRDYSTAITADLTAYTVTDGSDTDTFTSATDYIGVIGTAMADNFTVNPLQGNATTIAPHLGNDETTLDYSGGTRDKTDLEYIYAGGHDVINGDERPAMRVILPLATDMTAVTSGVEGGTFLYSIGADDYYHYDFKIEFSANDSITFEDVLVIENGGSYTAPFTDTIEFITTVGSKVGVFDIIGSNPASYAVDTTTGTFFGTGVAHLVGSTINDTIDLTSDTATTTGSLKILGLGGDDNITGSDQADVHDNIYGGSGTDTINGLDGEDFIYGGADNDILNGGEGFDNVYGEDGDDTLIYDMSDSYSADNYDGGVGTDDLVLDLSATNYGQYLAHRDDVLNYKDFLANGGDSFFFGFGLTAEGFETLEIKAEGDFVEGTSGNNTITGTANGDIIEGGSGNDLLDGAGGNDAVFGDNGNDTLIGGSGNDLLVGNKGADIADYSNDGAGITANLNTGVVTDGSSDTDTLVSIEGIIGSDYNDDFTVNVRSDDDWIDGGTGTDHITFTDGASFSRGRSIYINSDGTLEADRGGIFKNIETFSFGSGTASFTIEELGNDYQTSGYTILSYINLASGITADLVNGSITDGSDTDTFDESYNHLIIGTNHNDHITLDNNTDTIATGLGNDTVVASGSFMDSVYYFSGGDDTITGVDEVRSRFYLPPDVEDTDISVDFTYKSTIQETGIPITTGDYLYDIKITIAGHGSITLEDQFVTVNYDGSQNPEEYDVPSFNHLDFVSFVDGARYDYSFNQLNSVSDPDTIVIENSSSSHENFRGSMKDDVIDLSAYGQNYSEMYFYAGDDDVIGTEFGEDIYLDMGDDVAYGGGGSDFILGGFGDDIIDGGAGDDIIRGGAGDDTLIYVLNENSGTDEYFGGSGADKLILTFTSSEYANLTSEIIDYNDHILAYSNPDLPGGNTYKFSFGLEASDIETAEYHVVGTSFNNYLTSGTLNEVLKGFGGNDTYVYDSALDIFEEGGGEDTIQFGSGVTVYDLTIADDGTDDTLITLDSGVDEILLSHNRHANTDYQFEYLRFDDGMMLNFTDYNNWIYGLTSGETISGTSSDDTILADAGNDIVSGGNGNDQIDGGEGNDDLRGGGGDDILYGGNGDDILRSQGGNDIMYGGAGADLFITLSDDEIMYGGAGDDVFRGYAGEDTYYGGEGTDKVWWRDYTHGSSIGINADLSAGTAIDGYGSVSTLVDIENLTGSDYDDILKGDDNINNNRGGEGNDTLYGYGADDLLYGDDGDDTLYGGDGDDVIYGNNDDDTIYGGDGEDNLYGNSGNDTFYTGDGFDRVWGDTGADTFILEAASAYNNRDQIKDFSTSDGDILDLSDLLAAYDPMTDLITDFVQITDSGTDTIVAVDADGGANNFLEVALLENITGLTDEEALETAGTLITA